MKKTMKKTIYILSLAAWGLFATACSDFLEEFPHNAIADEVAVTNVAEAQVAMNGVYDYLRDYRLYGRNIFVLSDVMAEDVVLRTDNSNRFTRQYRWDLQSSDADSEDLWQYAYKAIKAANVIIQKLPAAELATGETEEARGQVLGEAYFVRALMYYELTKFFAQAYNYTADAGHPGVPYVKEPTMTNDHARNTVKECFDNIIADANQALSLMNVENPTVPYSAGKLAAKALLARVYLYIAGPNNAAYYATAATNAEEVITAAKYTLVDAADYEITVLEQSASAISVSSPKMWGAANNTESIFTLPYSSSERNYTNALSRIYLSKGTTGSYGDLLPSQQILALIGAEPSDVRNSLFITEIGNNPKTHSFKFMGDGKTNWDLNSINIFRLSELYLIAAEGYVKGATPDINKAHTYLNDLRTKRGLTALSGLTAATLSSEIADERRRELCFEGHALPDHKRLNTAIVRTADPENPENQNLGQAYPSHYFAFPIPLSELNTNKLIENNPEY
jgi:hypothetical protein